MLRPLVLSATSLVLVACGGADPSPEEQRATLTEDLAGDLVTETDGALDDEQARCVAEALVESVGVESFDRVVAAAGGQGDEDEQLRLTVIDAFSGCDALEPLLDGSDR